MLIKSPASLTAAGRFADSLDAVIGWLSLATKQFYRAIRHRRDLAALVHQDDYLLADIGLTRSDVRHAIAQPLWHDPTEILRRCAAASHRASHLKRSVPPADHDHHVVASLDASDLAELHNLGRQVSRDVRGAMVRVCLAGLAASVFACLGATQAFAQPVCKPALAISDVQFSPMRPPTLRRKWMATVSVDTSHCADSSQGTFEIGFSRLKENAPEIDFRERFRWQASSMQVDVDFWADEAVERYWLGNIEPCLCRG